MGVEVGAEILCPNSMPVCFSMPVPPFESKVTVKVTGSGVSGAGSSGVSTVGGSSGVQATSDSTSTARRRTKINFDEITEDKVSVFVRNIAPIKVPEIETNEKVEYLSKIFYFYFL